MLRLLGLDGPTRQWREIKASVMKGEDASSVKSSRASKTHSCNMFQLSKHYISEFADRHKNYQPVDNKDSKDENKFEVIVPFESISEFHK